MILLLTIQKLCALPHIVPFDVKPMSLPTFETVSSCLGNWSAGHKMLDFLNFPVVINVTRSSDMCRCFSRESAKGYRTDIC